MSITQGNGQGVPWGLGKPEVTDYTKITQGQAQLPDYPLQGAPFGGGINQLQGSQGQPQGGLPGTYPPQGAYPESFGSTDGGWSGQAGYPPGFQTGSLGGGSFPSGRLLWIGRRGTGAEWLRRS
ncbi:hypothetical protein [Paenibacillus sp. 1P03SA]|uniref:hypothetical protein n=1 Tax=Paenibacillus sp. 1P03SA TaxID=3132294 RepID=UPI0039A39554